MPHLSMLKRKMADLLIYHKTHWLLAPSKTDPGKTGYDAARERILRDCSLLAVDPAERLAKLDEALATRWVPGDIVEVQDTGRYGHGSFRTDSFCVVRVLDRSKADLQWLTKAFFELEKTTLDGHLRYVTKRILAKRRYRVDLSQVSLPPNDKIAVFDKFDDVPIIDKSDG